jgi:phosphohistidine phosphatase
VKRLTLMRHGNAKWKDPEVADFERPLNRRGVGEGEAMARRLAELALVPTLILASPATRTKQTADIVARELGLSSRHVRTDETLYLARAEDILKVIQATGPRVPHLMIVGHNPGF